MTIIDEIMDRAIRKKNAGKQPASVTMGPRLYCEMMREVHNSGQSYLMIGLVNPSENIYGLTIRVARKPSFKGFRINCKRWRPGIAISNTGAVSHVAVN